MQAAMEGHACWRRGYAGGAQGGGADEGSVNSTHLGKLFDYEVSMTLFGPDGQLGNDSVGQILFDKISDRRG